METNLRVKVIPLRNFLLDSLDSLDSTIGDFFPKDFAVDRKILRLS